MTTEEIDQLAHKMAEEFAKTDIESGAMLVNLSGTRWWNIGDVDSAAADDIDQAVLYLDARGVLEHNSDNPQLVRWEHADD